jgi:hypothetical protein
MDRFNLVGEEKRMGQKDFLNSVFDWEGLQVDIFRCGYSALDREPDPRRGLLKEYAYAVKCHSVFSELRPLRVQWENIAELAYHAAVAARQRPGPRKFQPWSMMAEFLREWQVAKDMRDDPDRTPQDELRPFPNIQRFYVDSKKAWEGLRKELEDSLRNTVVDWDGNTVTMKKTVELFRRAWNTGHVYKPDEPVQVIRR